MNISLCLVALLVTVNSYLCFQQALFNKVLCTDTETTEDMYPTMCAGRCMRHSGCFGFGIRLDGTCEEFFSFKSATCLCRNDLLAVYRQTERSPINCDNGGIPNSDKTACICPAHLSGTFCQLGCWQNGEPYKGLKNTTATGKTCQRWDSQIPHAHRNNRPEYFPDNTVEEAENYCRDPDFEPRPWCYTTDSTVRYEHCDIEPCECCKYTGNYTGTQNFTASGLSCQRWDEQTPHSHPFTDAAAYPDATVSQNANYCRKLADESQPWCYTLHPNRRWEYCFEQCN